MKSISKNKMSLFKDNVGGYSKAILKVFLPIGLSLCAMDVFAKTTLDVEEFETAVKTIESWINRGMWVVAAGGLGVSSYYGFVKNSWTEALPGAVIGVGVPVIYKAMEKAYTLLI